MIDWLSRIERLTRPVDDRTRAALQRRWDELPAHVKTPAQTLGRAGVGCEGTHGVFPRCNFACRPCYHSRDANHVRVDGAHTLAEVDRQIGYLSTVRAPHAHAQLIGGEVSLLDPDDHAAALLVMRRHGREPMSFTHGDFDYDYLRRLAIGTDGRRRFRRLSFAAHIDTTMVGRRGIRRADREQQLDGERRRFVEMFRRLRREHGVRFYLAHNMTVTPDNVDQIPELIGASRHFGFSMFSFQPAAYVGDERRWDRDYRTLEADRVWRKIEAGVGSALPYDVLQFGDVRCNRAAFGFYLGERWHSLLDPGDPADLQLRDSFFEWFGGMHFNAPRALLAVRLVRAVARHPRSVPMGLAWLRRTMRRVGGAWVLLRHRIVPTAFVMHRFMHADDVSRAWELLERGETSADPAVRETQERLKACAYAMAHPGTRRVVPACVQHSILDPAENVQLRRVLPLISRRPAERDAPGPAA